MLISKNLNYSASVQEMFWAASFFVSAECLLKTNRRLLVLKWCLLDIKLYYFCLITDYELKVQLSNVLQ